MEKININNLKLIPTRHLADIKLNTKNNVYKRGNCPVLWVITDNIKPVDLYCYLQARFGEPNGLMTIFKKKNDSDNLVHWDYSFEYEGYVITIMCMTYRIEVHKAMHFDDQKIAKIAFINDIKMDFKNYSKEISNFRKRIETWNLFVNPFQRLKNVIETQLQQLAKLDIDNIEHVDFKSRKINPKQIKKASIATGKKYIEATSLGLSLRMIIPVYAESFINLLIFTLVKPEIKGNKKDYDTFFREKINLRIKNLHEKCIGFYQRIDYDNIDSCKKFQTLMNSRNDLLHGNITPLDYKFDLVYFDNCTPLFSKFSNLAFDSWQAGLKNIEFNRVIEDYQTVQDFISYVLICLDYAVAIQMIGIMNESFPGYNEKTKRLGRLFSDRAVDFFVDVDDSTYKFV